MENINQHFTPHVDTGDHVIIINAEKIELTGKKLNDKIYYRHTMHPGGLKLRTALEMRTNYPEKMLELAIKGMLPKNSLGRQMFKKLHVYAGAEHPHEANNLKYTNFADNYKGGYYIWHKFNIMVLVVVKAQLLVFV